MKKCIRLNLIFLLFAALVYGNEKSAILKNTPHKTSAYNIYWGDIHCHTSYSDCPASTQNTSPPQAALSYARDIAKLDFVAITDHAEDLSDSEWVDIQFQNEQFYAPGEFVTFNAWEYTLTGLVEGGGHKNVYFADDNVPARAFGCDYIENAEILWDSLADYNCITIPHHPAKGNNGHFTPSSMATDWSVVNAEMQPLVEIYQSQGNSEVIGCEEPVNDFQQLKSVEVALKRWLINHDPAYKLGIECGTDDHASQPGSVFEQPAYVDTAEGYSSGGLIAALATEKTRADIFDALRAKRVYGTSGPRIVLDFKVIANSDTFRMGETIQNSSALTLTLTASAIGDGAEIDKIVIIKNGEILCEGAGGEIFVQDTAEHWCYYRVKVYQKPTLRWDGVLFPERAWSSPIWLEIGTTGIAEKLSPAVDYKIQLSCYPNPFNSMAKINFFVPTTGNIRLTVFDLLGREIRQISNDNFNAGWHSLLLDASSFSTGLYFLHLDTEAGAITEKILFTK